MKSTVTSKGQTTIPKRIREALRLEEGTQIDWDMTAEGTLTVRPVQAPNDRFQAALGRFPLPTGQMVEDVMRELRGERDPDLVTGPGAQVLNAQDFLDRWDRK